MLGIFRQLRFLSCVQGVRPAAGFLPTLSQEEALVTCFPGAAIRMPQREEALREACEHKECGNASVNSCCAKRVGLFACVVSLHPHSSRVMLNRRIINTQAVCVM